MPSLPEYAKRDSWNCKKGEWLVIMTVYQCRESHANQPNLLGSCADRPFQKWRNLMAEGTRPQWDVQLSGVEEGPMLVWTLAALFCTFVGVVLADIHRP